MKLSEIHNSSLETVWINDLSPAEIASIELESTEDNCLLYDDFIYGKYLEKQKNLKEAGTQFKGGKKAFVVKGGKKVKVKVRRRAKPLSSKQKIGLRKARRKANTGAAKIKRARSNRVRSRLKLKKVKGGVRGGALKRNR